MATTQQSGSTMASAPALDPEVPALARTRTFSPRYKLDILNWYESERGCGQRADQMIDQANAAEDLWCRQQGLPPL